MSILRVGTDCSGIEAPIQALLQLKIPFEHVFSSEIDKYCIQSIKANYKPKIIFGDKDGLFPEGDITKRSIKDVPDIDLYVCGFPCQPFSTAGKREGFKDKRGNVFWSCLEVIELKKPKYFILENVRGLLSHNKGNTWKVIWEALSGLEKYGYNVQWKVLNTRDYGIPQNRERVFIVGTKGSFEWPDKQKMDDIKEYVDWKDKTSRNIPKYVLNSKLLEKIPKDAIFIDTGFQYFNFPFSHLYSSCLTSGHTSNIWCVPLSRYANIHEWKCLQGFQSLKRVVSKTQYKKQLGNSMSVNVLKILIKNIYYTD
jgi:DNA (cytosine-5)-methyltransferase 1